MVACRGSLLASFVVTTSLLLSFDRATAATQPVDLDALPANAAESMCSTEVLSPFPVQIENRVTNRTNGDAFRFSWFSAGPGGFISSVTAGTAPGVGAVWLWTSDESMVGFTGTSCATDVCFTKTAGPDSVGSFCSDSCVADATTIKLRKINTTDVELSWTGGTSTFTVYRGSTKIGVVAPANSVGTTNTFVFTDRPPATSNAFYIVRGTDCTTRKPCTSNADCIAPTEGTCVSRGPFGVPGRSLVSTEVTVSAASLTSSLITFFSPSVEVFRATSTSTAGGVEETFTNFSSTPLTVTTPAYPPGCCPFDSDHPHRIRCGDECVDYLSDPHNCGACGNECGDLDCCVQGVCLSVCDEGEIVCGEECVDPEHDNQNCGTCGNDCGNAGCCDGGQCQSICEGGDIFCGGYCINPDYDDANCGSCGSACTSGTCCSAGQCQSMCQEDWTYCISKGDYCADLRNDNNNCGGCYEYCETGTCCSESGCVPLECNLPPGGGWELFGDQCYFTIHDNSNCGGIGNVCPVGTCCNGEGTCNPPCYEETETACGDQCAELPNDNDNCGSCGNTCDDGECCNGGTCVSVCSPARTFCDGQCVDTAWDNENCGECGNECYEGDVCCKGTCLPYSYECSEETTPEDPYCPNEDLRDSVPIADRCPGPVAPQPATCPNPNTTTWDYPHCPGDDVAVAASPSYCDSELYGGSEFTCPGESPYPPPAVEEAPICTQPETTTLVNPGLPQTTCTPGGPLFVEVPTAIVVCGDGIPGIDGQCAGASPKTSIGTFNRLVPHPTAVPGDAFVTPLAVHVVLESSGDGMLGPGESGDLLLEILNAGSVNITGATGTLASPLVDLTNDGLANPVGLTVGTTSSAFGTIHARPNATGCSGPKPIPATNATLFHVTVPPDFPGDTSAPLILTINGNVGGRPFTMEVPLSIGIADACNAAQASGDFDGLDGLLAPMAKLVPEADTVQFPNKAFRSGDTRPLKLRVGCGGVNITSDMLNPPRIVALSEATRGPIDITGMNLSADDPAVSRDFYFMEYDMLSGPHWHYNLNTQGLGTGTFTLTIKIAGRKNYVTGFVLR